MGEKQLLALVNELTKTGLIATYGSRFMLTA